MRHPFQCLHYCTPTSRPQQPILLAAAGPRLSSFSLQDHCLLSTWTGSTDENGKDLIKDEQVGKKISRADPGSNYFTRLATASDGTLVVGITDDDKSIRVFTLSPGGELQLLSVRSMPKRPCAIAISSNDATIFCADKFGDVYSLPMLIPFDGIKDSDPLKAKPQSLKDSVPNPKGPSASFKTVHTASNHRALQHQLRALQEKPEKKGPEFDHELLLGHVSILTDLIFLSTGERGARATGLGTYLITSDRDEHIRVSRGPPQAHVIQAYCLAHTQFVSRIFCPDWSNNVLVSGGGDNYLCVWNWITGKLLQRVPLWALVSEVRQGHSQQLAQGTGEKPKHEVSQDTHAKTPTEATNAEEEVDSEPILSQGTKHHQESEVMAVSGIYGIETSGKSKETQVAEGEIIVTCEAVPAFFSFHLSAAGLHHVQTVPLEANVVGLTTCQSDSSLIVSLDNLHEPWSSTNRTASVNVAGTSLRKFALGTGDTCTQWSEVRDEVPGLEGIVEYGSFEVEESKLDSVTKKLYCIEPMRKRDREREDLD